MKPVHFAPGPSELYFTVEDHLRLGLRQAVPSLSHRSKEFERIVERVSAGLRQLLELPDNFHIAFTASATEIWERSIQNLVAAQSTHYVNGSFSAKYAEIASQLGRTTEVIRVNEGHAFHQPTRHHAELIALTHNETSTGVALPLEFIHGFRTLNPNTLVIVDAVSSLPFPQFDFSKIDSVFFSVQKCFGLPPGLGVWIFNDRCIDKSNQMKKSGHQIGSYHSLPSLHQFALKNQTPETPNTLGIWLLAGVVEDFLRKGIQTIRRETEYKAAILYQALDQHPLVKPFVLENQWRSKTVIVAQTGNHTQRLSEHLAGRGLLAGDGYGPGKGNQLRFANFPTHSKEQYEWLVDSILDFKG